VSADVQPTPASAPAPEAAPGPRPRPQPGASARRPPAHLFAGAIALAASEVLLLRHVEPVYTWFYSFAWWSWILLVDGLVWWREGDSLLVSRTRELFWLAFWSVAAWNVYEVFNFRVHDWYYVLVPAGFWSPRLNTAIAFATVLPCVFETTELVTSLGLFDRARTKPWRVGRGLLAAIFAMGVAMLVLPLAWPSLFFGMIWGSVAFLLEPFVYAFGGRSLLRDFERGDPRRFLRLLFAGFVTGGLWEFFNFWTRTKWIYTVPGMERLKLFEMPIAGFIGFPPFVVECFVMYSFLGLFRDGRGWERGADRVGRGARRAVAIAGVAGAIVFNALVIEGICRWTVSSTDLPIAALPAVSASEAQALAAAGARRPVDLLHDVEREGIAAVASASGLDEGRVADLVGQARMVEAKGLGVENVALLREAGVASLASLAAQDPVNLTLALQPIAAARGRPAPYEMQVAVWVRQARRLTGH